MPTLVFMKLFEDASQTLIAKLWHHLLQQLSKITNEVLTRLWDRLFSPYHEVLKGWISSYLLIGTPFVTHLMAWLMNLIISATVSIHTHLLSSSSHTSSSSTPSLMKILMALMRLTVLSMEHMAELIGMQSYAEWESSMSAIRLLRVN